MATLEGALLKDGGWRRGWRKRYFKLTKVYFQYYENEFSTSPKGAVVRGTIQNVELVELSTYHFKVTLKSEIWDLQATSRQEMMKWMEALKPSSAALLMKQMSQSVSEQPNHRQTVTSFQPEPAEHVYQPLPQSFTVNPRSSVGSDGRSSPSTASPRVRTTSATSQSSARSTSPGGRTSVTEHQNDAPPRANQSKVFWSRDTHQPIRAGYSSHQPISVRQSMPCLPSNFTPALPLYTLSQRRKSCDVALAEQEYQDPCEALPEVTRQPSNLAPSTLALSNAASANVVPLDYSDDEFLDFEEDDYINHPGADTLTAVSSLRKEIRSLQLSDKSTASEDTAVSDDRASVAVNVIPNTPDGPIPSKNAYSEAILIPNMNELPEYMNENERPEYMNDCSDRSMTESEASTSPLRRSIKSLKSTGNINYCINTPTITEPDSPDHGPEFRNIKSTGPVTNDHTLHTRDSTNSFLNAASPSPTNGISTMRIKQWIKDVKIVKKAFVDPDDKELGELDKYLLENSPCLPKEQITLVQKIGNGAFGDVWKGRCDPTIGGDSLVAVKCLKEGSSDKHRHDFYGEAALLGQFRHANVIALHGVVLQGQSPWIVIEYAENGALKSFLKKNGEDRHSNQLLGYCRDIVRGMRYLSERGYIHRDLAARNVLLTRMEVCKIADFGLSRKLGDDDDIYVSRGGMVAIKWTAPEGVLGASYSSASDVWSCGVTMWEVFSSGANPFSGQSNEEAFRNIRRGGRLTRPEKCPLEVYTSMLKCWAANPLERPTFGELDGMLFDPNVDNLEQPLYENTDGFVQYMNLSYENMQDVERT